MNDFLNGLWKQAKKKTGKWAETVKAALQRMQGTEHITIHDLATVLLLHPETQIKQEEYLNLIFNDCYLKLNKFEVYLETKGKKHQQILGCRIMKQGQPLIHYQSYRAKDDKIALPSEVSVSLSHYS
ncbi:hypothetical protein SAMN05421676_11323 [Salinibacillus kushneri]|uniref:Uncharacterized protein n=1 Tax=Salinibacillus kushneri TaxID=237682 RepID=A0A1I0IPF3_9BACI|nr:hypothetical protein [Salinibacillus kushneri]SET98315.1 hypothetical protein SAMN05421676_11323 [Salinibacillus kushneri]